MRQLHISSNGTWDQSWTELGIKFDRSKQSSSRENVLLVLPMDMWLEADEHQLYRYKIICYRGIVLGYVYEDNILVNEHGKDIYLTAKVNGKLYQYYMRDSI